ncbi:MAG: SDR family oxidoreductase [Myxococcales bacterium]|nr:SDR family oxidoreductase [Myxococcales bacterium]
MPDATQTLLTGFPATLLGRRMLLKILEAEPQTRLLCLSPPSHADEAEDALIALPQPLRERTELVVGDVTSMDLGLSGKRFNDLAARVEVIHHCDAVSHAGASRAQAERTNVTGTAEILELAEACSSLRRLVHWSSALVSGKREGRVAESELVPQAHFPSVIEETRYRAERMVRAAMDHLPVTILRPAMIVGDSRTGEIDRMEGPYLLILLMLSSPVDLRVPLPGRGDVPLNMVPIDYVVDAGHAIATHAGSIGRSFHLVDERPPTARRIFELIAEAAGRPGPVGGLPTQLASVLLRTPGLERFSHIPRAFLEHMATAVSYDARNTRELLTGSGIECPPAGQYLTVMVDYVRSHQQQRNMDRSRERPEHDDEAVDPLEG